MKSKFGPCECPEPSMFCDSFEVADDSDVIPQWLAPPSPNITPLQTTLVKLCDDAAMVASVNADDESAVFARGGDILPNDRIVAAGIFNVASCDPSAAGNEAIRLAQLRIDNEAFLIEVSVYLTVDGMFQLGTHPAGAPVNFVREVLPPPADEWVPFELEIDLTGAAVGDAQATLRIGENKVGPVAISGSSALPESAQLVLGVQPTSGNFTSNCDVIYELASLRTQP